MAVVNSAALTNLTITASVAGSHSQPAARLHRLSSQVLLFSPLSNRRFASIPSRTRRKRNTATVFFVLDESGKSTSAGDEIDDEEEMKRKGELMRISKARATERMERKQSERTTYLIAAVMSSFGITSMAVAAVYYRFAWQMEGGEIPMTEMFGTFALSVGAAVGMEFWARWAHRALWHASLWHMHESHHRPREGPFELNDVFAIVNAVPAISLLSFGFFNRGLVPGLCFGADDILRHVAGCDRAWGLLSLVSRTCSSTTDSSTAGSRWGPSPTFHTSVELLLLIRSTTRRSSTGCHMGCSWAPRNWRRWEAQKSWRKRSRGGSRGSSRCFFQFFLFLF